jgi:hypothetical protein
VSGYLALGDGWRLWRLAAVRSAGFPFSDVLCFATPGLAAAADRLLALEGGAPPPDAARLAAAREELRLAFAEAGQATAAAAERVFADPRFQEALCWQNRTARAILDGVATRPGAARRNQAQRRFEELVARYWQRYCAKNDTIGFFGPAGWAGLSDRAGETRVEPGERLVGSRTVSFELWCLEAFASAAAARHGLLPHAPPVRSPSVRLDGREVRQDRGAPVRLTAAEVAVLERCTGDAPAARIAAEVAALPDLGLRREADVYLLLERLAARRLLEWDLPVALDLRPECRLRERLAVLPDAGPALAELDELEAARDAVAAADAPVRLDAAMARLDATFTRLTGLPPTRRPGQEYAGRGLVYLDSRRDLRVELGPEVTGALGPPLELMLRSARWLTAETAGTYEEALTGVFRRLAAETGSARVAMSELWFWSQALFFGAGDRPADRVRRDFRSRWERLLAASREFGSDALRPAVERAFPACSAGWPGARYHSFDVQLAAAGVEDVRAGRFHLVLGEAHFALNPMAIGVFQSQHPDTGELVAYAERDVPEDRVVLALPREWPRFSTRTVDLLPRPRDLRLVFAPAARYASGRHLALADLAVEEGPGGLMAATADGAVRLPVVHVLGDLLSVAVTEAFKDLATGDHVPRTCIDRLVVRRESWAFEPGELAFAAARREEERFVAARRWAAATGLPRFVFARVPGELKPLFVDLESLTYVNVLAGRVRRAAGAAEPVVVSEMLPGPDELWLPDAAGRRYSAELRVVAVDGS